MPKLTIKQATFVKAKLQGKNNIESAQLATGTENRSVAAVQATRMLNNVKVAETIDKSVNQVLDDARVSLSDMLQPFIEALTMKYEHKEKYKKPELRPFYDIDTRMKAGEKLLNFSNALTRSNQPQNKPNQELLDAIHNEVDDVELQRIVFKKPHSDQIN